MPGDNTKDLTKIEIEELDRLIQSGLVVVKSDGRIVLKPIGKSFSGKTTGSDPVNLCSIHSFPAK